GIMGPSSSRRVRGLIPARCGSALEVCTAVVIGPSWPISCHYWSDPYRRRGTIGTGRIATMRGRSLVEDQAGRSRVRVEPAVRTYQASFCGRPLPAGMDYLALRANQRHRVGQRADDVELELERCVGLARRQRRVHGAPHRRIEQRGEPAAMDGAKWVVVLQSRLALKHGQPRLDVDGYEVERIADRRTGQGSGQ